MTFPGPLLPRECFASCSFGVAQSRRRSSGESAGGRMLSVRERPIQPGLGPVPGAAEHHIEHRGLVASWKYQCCKLVLLCFHSFPTCQLRVQWGAVKSVPCSSPDLLSTDQGFKGLSWRKLMFELFLMSWLSKLEAEWGPAPTAQLVLTQGLETPPSSASSAFCWWCYLMTTCLCRERLKYADLGVFLLVFI